MLLLLGTTATEKKVDPHSEYSGGFREVRGGRIKVPANTSCAPFLNRYPPPHKHDLREVGGSFLLCFFAAIDSSGDGKAKTGLKFFVTQKLTAWQLFLIFNCF